MLWLIALLAAGEPSNAPDPIVDRMVALYDEVCLKAFPDDAAVDALMASKGATALTPDEVRVTFPDDPGRGWLLADGDRNMQIMLELPPFHACSVRRTTAMGFGDLMSYRVVADAYKESRPGFVSLQVYETDVAGRHVHAVGEQRPLADGGSEALFLIDQRMIDPARRANGETAVDIRFVHQFVSPNAR